MCLHCKSFKIKLSFVLVFTWIALKLSPLTTTKNSIKSEACRYELFLANKYNIEILPIKGTDISWDDLSQIDLLDRNKHSHGDLDLSDPKEKFEFNRKNFNEICEKLSEYVKAHETELKKGYKDKDAFENTKKKILDFINSNEFKMLMNDDFEDFNDLFQEVSNAQITSSEYFWKLGQIKRIVNEELIKTQTPIDQEASIKIKCFEALEHIINFYFENIDDTNHKPKEFIEKERRREIMSEIAFLNNYKEIASNIGIYLSGTWDPTTHSRGINHEIFIILNDNLILKIIQHEYGEAMRMSLTLNGELIINPKDIESIFTNIKSNSEKPSIIELNRNSKKIIIDIAQQIENDFQKMLEKNSIEGDLEFQFLIFPIIPSKDVLFDKKDYEDIRKIIRTNRYGPAFISSSFDSLFNELTFLRSGIYAIRNIDYPSGNIFLSKEGVIIFHYCYRKYWDKPENYKRFNSYYISGVLLGFFDFIEHFFKTFNISGKISLSLNIAKIEDWKFSPISMDIPVDDEAFYYFQPDHFKPYLNEYDLSQLGIKDNRIKAVEDIMSEILLDFGYEREFKINSRILREY